MIDTKITPTITFTQDGQTGRYGDTVFRGIVTGPVDIDAAFAALKGNIRLRGLVPMGELPPNPFCLEVKALAMTADGVWAFEIVRRWND